MGAVEILIGAASAIFSFMVPVRLNKYPYEEPSLQHTRMSMREVNHVMLIGALSMLLNLLLVLGAFLVSRDSWVFHGTLLGLGFLTCFLSAVGIGLGVKPRPVGQQWWPIRRVMPAVSAAWAFLRWVAPPTWRLVCQLGPPAKFVWDPIWRRLLRRPTYPVRRWLRRVRNYRRRAL